MLGLGAALESRPFCFGPRRAPQQRLQVLPGRPPSRYSALLEPYIVLLKSAGAEHSVLCTCPISLTRVGGASTFGRPLSADEQVYLEAVTVDRDIVVNTDCFLDLKGEALRVSHLVSKASGWVEPNIVRHKLPTRL